MATTTKERIITLDIVRGFAVMGILAMNIYAMASPGGTYFNPLAHGTEGPLDWLVWGFNFLFVDSKMRGLFSILFGASTLLVIERATANSKSPWLSHYARMSWLALFGLFHFYMIWWGDILFLYSFCGLIIFFFRNRSVKVLRNWGIVFLTISFLMMSLQYVGFQAYQSGAISAEDAEGIEEGLQEIEKFYGANPEHVAADLERFSGSYSEIVAFRTGEMALMPFQGLIGFGPETIGLMLLGMALFKSGMLSGEWPRERYVKWARNCLLVGIIGLVPLLYMQVATNFDTINLMWITGALSMPFDVLMAIGWAALFIVWVKSGQGAMHDRVAATGRMAFTNYLMTSVIMTTLFYGYGLGLYGDLNRAALYLVVIAMWVLMLLWSKPWLDRFHYGPLEWLWRSLSRFSLQPMRKQAA